MHRSLAINAGSKSAASVSVHSGFSDQDHVNAFDPVLSFNVINFTASSRPGV